MKYNLNRLQRYNTLTLQSELSASGIIASINGYGENSFSVITDEEEEADIIVRAHIAKSDMQHDSDIDGAEKDEMIDQVIGQNRGIIKALILCINDGSIVPGANISNAALKVAIKSKL